MTRLFSLLAAFLLVACWGPGDGALHGYVEGELVRVAPTTGGILLKLYVERSQAVAAGTPLFALDLAPLVATREAAAAALAQAEAEEARVRDLKDKTFRSAADLERAAAVVAEARAALARASENVRYAAPTAPTAARVEDTYFCPGEYVPAGTPVVALLPPGNVKVRFFVPQARLPDFPLEQRLTVTCDGCGEPLPAHVTHIADSVEYTPPVIFSIGSRDKLVVLVEAAPDTPDPVLRPGLPVDIKRVP